MKRLGKYELVEHLASGGMADIWLADQLGPLGFRKRVVVKRIKSDHSDDPDYEAMFLDEARLSAQLVHTNIVQTLELGESDDGEWFVAMEWIDGPSLEDLLERANQTSGRLDPAVVIRIGLDLLAALSYAHDFVTPDGQHLEIVHRDVTPSNVLLTRSGTAKLADFGIAKAVGRQTKTQTGAVKGKFGYMAPEQVQGEEVDPRADVFAAGIVLYEALTGKRPFGDGLQAIHGVLERDAEPLHDVRPELPPDLCRVIDKALEKAPGDRWQSADQMRHALESAARETGRVSTTTEVAALTEFDRDDDEPDPYAQTTYAGDREVQSHAWLPVISVAAALLLLMGGAAVAVLVSPSAKTPHGSANDAGSEPALREKHRERLERIQAGPSVDMGLSDAD